MLQKSISPAGLGTLLLAKVGRGTLAKSASTAPKPGTVITTAPTRPPAFAINQAFAAVQRRDGLFGPMFAITKAETAASLTGPRVDYKTPQKPSPPSSMTTPAASYRRAAQVDVNEARQSEHIKATADARTVVTNAIKALHLNGGSPGAFGSAGPVVV